MEEAFSSSIHGFSKEGQWYKGNLHSHTTNSDGKLTPKEAVQLFREGGYNFLCLSEHDLYTDYRDEFDSETFKILPGLEASAVLISDMEKKLPLKVHHMHGILGTTEMQSNATKLMNHQEKLPPEIYVGDWDGRAVAQGLSDKLRSMGMFVTYNHPIWSRVESHEFVDVEGIWAVEIYNYNTVNECAEGYDTTHWDTMIRKGKKIYGFASDDNHNTGEFDDVLGGYVVVRAKCLSHEEIVKALLAGSFYSSSGPVIYDWGVNEGKVFVKTGPVERVNFIIGGFVGAGKTIIAKENSKHPSVSDENIAKRDTYNGEKINIKFDGGGIIYAGHKLTGNETFVRVECMDKNGRCAWTNPLFLGGE